MVNTDTSTTGDVQEPFFGDRGKVIRLRRAEVKPRLGGLYFFVWPLVATIVTIVMVALLWEAGVPLILVVALVVNYFFANRYFERNKEPALLFELSEENACMSCPDISSIPVVSVPFDEGTIVDVELNEAVTSKEYGHLCGWIFEGEEMAIKISTHDDWDLWDIQGLREPVYKLMEHHGMEQGDALRYYQEGLLGVTPLRRRGYDPPSLDSPTL
jgi:hypothetical protein